MQTTSTHGDARKRRRLSPPEPGPYILRNLLKDVPLASNGDHENVQISCVEFWSTYLPKMQTTHVNFL